MHVFPWARDPKNSGKSPPLPPAQKPPEEASHPSGSTEDLAASPLPASVVRGKAHWKRAQWQYSSAPDVLLPLS